MSAFVASMRLKPKLNPRHEDTAQYISTHQGVTIEAKFVILTVCFCDILTAFSFQRPLVHISKQLRARFAKRYLFAQGW